MKSSCRTRRPTLAWPAIASSSTEPEALAGSVALDWSGDAPITRWQGVWAEGSPGRVRELTLAGLGLNGSIPAALSGLDQLRRLEPLLTAAGSYAPSYVGPR